MKLQVEYGGKSRRLGCQTPSGKQPPLVDRLTSGIGHLGHAPINRGEMLMEKKTYQLSHTTFSMQQLMKMRGQRQQGALWKTLPYILSADAHIYLATVYSMKGIAQYYVQLPARTHHHIGAMQKVWGPSRTRKGRLRPRHAHSRTKKNTLLRPGRIQSKAKSEQRPYRPKTTRWPVAGRVHKYCDSPTCRFGRMFCSTMRLFSLTGQDRA